MNDTIFVVAIAEEILFAQQHLQAGVGQKLAEGAEALPGVLASGDHVVDAHARSHQALVHVAEDDAGDFN